MDVSGGGYASRLFKTLQESSAFIKLLSLLTEVD